MNEAHVGLLTLNNLVVQASSLVNAQDAEFAIAHENGEARLAILAPTGSPVLSKFDGITSEQGSQTLLLGPTNAHNMNMLRSIFDWLRPRTLGLATSAGFGDRLGLATPGHIRALRAVGGNIAPIFAQQSIREMTRTSRSPNQVIDAPPC